MEKKWLGGAFVVLGLVFVVFVVGYSSGSSPTGYGLFEWMFNFKAPSYKDTVPIEKITCGNGVCDTGEDFLTCPQDCPSKTETCVCGWQRNVSNALVTDYSAGSITVDPAGNSYVVGGNSIGPGTHAWVAKYDVCGNEVWSNLYLSYMSLGTAITIGPDGFVYVTAEDSIGRTVSGAFGSKIVILKLDPTTGDVKWSQFYDWPETGEIHPIRFYWDVPLDIILDSQMNIFVTGYITTEIDSGDPSDPFPRDSGQRRVDLWIGKFKEKALGDGANLLVETTYNDLADLVDVGGALMVDSQEGSLYVTGYTGAFIAPYNHLFLQKYSTADLSPLWSSPVEGSIVGGITGVVGKSVKLKRSMLNSTLYVGGIAGTSSSTDGFVGFFDPTTGVETSPPLYLNGLADQRDGVRDLLVDSSIIYLTGTRTDVPVTYNYQAGEMWIATIDLETLDIVWSDIIEGSSRHPEFGSKLARDSAGHLYVIGYVSVDSSDPECISPPCSHKYIIHKYC